MNIVLKIVFFNCLLLGFSLVASAAESGPVVDHQMQVRLDPADQQLEVIDRITLAQGQFDFYLHAGLKPVTNTPGARLRRTAVHGGNIPLEVWRASLPPGQRELTLTYGGTIAHDFSSRTEAPGKQQQLLAGTISDEGVFLDGSVAWYPRIPDTLQTFRMEVSLPDGWTAVSQGAGPNPSDINTLSWQEQQPQDDIYLVAGKFITYTELVNDTVEAQVYLRHPDKALAKRYLAVTRQYMELYQQIIGPYPYAKFALVENFWETGYGMPSFTLLGPTVIRLPFILHSSYPHEVLHNWWGNGVYVDYAGGNWSEGLTTYLADHLIQEQKGLGISYRRNTLQRYASFVREENDFPLRVFRARHNEGSQAVGYGKSMMLFHMLRRKLGDETFIAGLRTFYVDNLFRAAGFEHLRRAFEQVSGQNLEVFFAQWLDRKGAPKLMIEELRAQAVQDAYHIRGKITQVQDDSPFRLDIPVLVYFEDQAPPELHTLRVEERNLNFTLTLPTEPARIEFDPWFDLFRVLDPAELPASLSQLQGSESILFVLPSTAPEPLQAAYHQLALQWSAGYTKNSIVFDNELSSLEGHQAVWLLGNENLFTESFLVQLPADQFSRTKKSWSLVDHIVNHEEQSLVLTHRDHSAQVIGLISAPGPAAVSGLTRKLPHYGKYSYLVFEGDAPTNLHKGQWVVTQSPMKFILSSSLHSGEFEPSPLWPAATR